MDYKKRRWILSDFDWTTKRVEWSGVEWSGEERRGMDLGRTTKGVEWI